VCKKMRYRARLSFKKEITSPAGTQWLSSLKTHRHYRLLVDWAEKSKRSDLLVPLPKELRAKVSSDYDQPIAGLAEKKA
jgi:hypothetical protein